MDILQLDLGFLPELPAAEEEDFPLRVVPDWDAQLARAESLCRTADQYLEPILPRGPLTLTPEQRVALVAALYARLN